MLRADLSTRNIERMDTNERKRLAASRRDRIGYVEAWILENPHPCTGTSFLPIICKRWEACRAWAVRYAQSWEEEMTP